jgi:hypothetical protein
VQLSFIPFPFYIFFFLLLSFCDSLCVFFSTTPIDEAKRGMMMDQHSYSLCTDE